MALQIPPFATLKPEDVGRALDGEIVRLQQMTDEVRADLEGFRGPTCLAQFLKVYHPDSGGLAALAELSILFEPQGNADAPRQPRKRKRKKPSQP